MSKRPELRSIYPGFFFVAIASSLSIVVSGCGTRSGPPIFVTSHPIVDLGLCDVGSTTFFIDVTNGGKSPLVISHVHSLCSCTIAETPPGAIAPGGSGQIKGKVLVSRGPGSVQIGVDTNEPNGGPVLRLKWFGKGVPTLLPSTLPIAIGVDEAVDRDVEITYPGDGEGSHLTLVSVSPLPEGVSIRLVSDDPDAIQADRALSPIPVAGRAVLRVHVIAASVPHESEVSCSVTVEHRGVRYHLPLTIQLKTRMDLEAHPERLLFSASGTENLKKIERVTTLKSTRGTKFQVVEKPDYLSVALNDAILKVRVAIPPPPGLTRGELVVKDEWGNRVAIPVIVGLASE